MVTALQLPTTMVHDHLVSSTVSFNDITDDADGWGDGDGDGDEWMEIRMKMAAAAAAVVVVVVMVVLLMMMRLDGDDTVSDDSACSLKLVLEA